MKKVKTNKLGRRILSILLTAALVVGLMPNNVLTVHAAATTHDISTGSLVISSNGDYTITGSTTSNTVTVKSGVTANVTLNGVKIDCSNTGITPIMVESGAKLNLTLTGDNTLTACTLDNGTNEQKTAALGVPVGAELVITENSTGTLTANGAKGGGAGIGGGYNSGAGTITINGGTITATSDNGAGIGGGYNKSNDQVTRNGGTVTINGGTVGATSTNGAGIGGGYYGFGGTVIIKGGTVNATSTLGAGIGGGRYSQNKNNYITVTIEGGTVNATSSEGAGIGGSDQWFSVTVTINGGTINATSTYGAGIGNGSNSAGYGNLTVTITGGNINSSAVTAPTNGTSAVACYTFKFLSDSVDMAGKTVSAITLDGNNYEYNFNDVVTLDGGSTNEGYLKLYLPEGSNVTSITVDNTTYLCRTEDGTCYTDHDWEAATCGMPKTCKVCGKTEGEPTGNHSWVDATCMEAKYCSVCGESEGERANHTYENGVCTFCGIDEQGTFHIKNSAQLEAFAQYVSEGNKNTNAVLEADIDMSDVKDWTPIGQTISFHVSGAEVTDTGYTGTFDGNGHVITGLTVSGISGDIYSYGLFGTVSGTVKHLGMDGFEFNMGSASDARAGSVAGQVLTDGTIENCYSIGHSVTTNGNIAGGIAGCNYGGTIRNCYAYNGSVSGHDTRWGGVVGDCQDDGNADAGTVTNCYTDDERVVSTQNDSTKITYCEKKDASAFESGEVTYKLNGSTSDGDLIWYQTLGTHNTPNFTGDIVMYSEGTYTNHTHEWIYSLGKTDESSNVYDKIVGVCRVAGCAEPERGVIFSIPENRVYTGSPIELVADSNTLVEGIMITYTAVEGSLTDGKPVNIGTYKAVASLTDADGQTVSTSDFIYEITKQQYTDISAVCESVDSAAKVNRAYSSIDETEYYTGTIEWSVAPVNNALDPTQDYTATVTLNAKLNYKFGNVSYDGWTVESNDGLKVVLKKTYYSCCGFEVSAAGNESVVLGTDYVYERNTKALHIVSDKPITIKNVNPSEKTDNHIVAGTGSNANITLAGVNINGSQPVLVKDDSGNVTITLKDGMTNTLTATSGAGLEKQGQNSTLIIQCEHASENGHVCDGNCGTLVATGAMYGAGIGGCGREYDSGEAEDPDKAIAYNITIKGGNITAHGGDGGAGIGAGGGRQLGSYHRVCGYNAKNIIIQGGIIEANGGDGGAGIGTGHLEYCGHSYFEYKVFRCENIQITGGAVTAIGGNGGAGIGAGSYINVNSAYTAYIEGVSNAVKDIVVKGGSLKVSAGYMAHAIGDGSFNDIYHGNYDETYATTPTNGNGSEVYLYCIANPDGKTVYIDGEAYAINNHTAVDGNDTNLYVYLTANTWNAPHTIKVGSDGATEKYYYRTSKLNRLAVGIYKIPENPATPTISGSSEYGAKQLSGYHLDGWTWITASKYPQVDGTNNMAYYNANYSTYDYSGIMGYNSSTNRVERHIPITITQKPITITADNKTIVYGDEDVALTYTISESTPLVGKDTLSGSITRVAGSDAGTYAIKQGTLANANYAITFHNGTYTIIKANAKLNFAEDTKTLGYDGAAVTSNELSDVVVTNESDKAINATVKYSYRVNGSTGEFTSGLPTNVGTYEVKAEMEDTTNYNAASDTMVLTIEKRELADCDISVIEAVTYDGTAQKPAVTVKIGNVTLNAGDYTIDYTDNINVGTATITITGNNNCTGSVTKTFVINPKTVTPTIEISDESYDYTAEAVEPEVTLKDGATVIPASEYGVAYTGNTNAGTATITVTDLEGGNYTFEAVSKEFAINKMTPTITWNDQTIASTGEEADITAPTLTFIGNDNPEVVLAYSYKAQGDAEYTTGLPTACGIYDVKVNVSATDNYNAVEDTMTLTITCTDADNNGICDHCGMYEAPEPVDGYYQIANIGNLMWFAQQVNEGQTTINAKLTADIDMKDIDWTIMNSFAGTFDGDGHTILYLCADESGGDDDIANGSRCGLFQTLSEGGTVTNLTISGAQLWSAHSAGAIAAVNNGTISKCIVKDSTIELGASHGLSAIAGTNTGTVTDCGVVNCFLQRRWGSANSSDYAIGVIVEDNSGTVSNCFSYGCTFKNSPNLYAIVESGNAPVNCYYYTDATVSDTVATAKTAEAFASGEVAYLLNGEKTDGTQSWYQTLETDSYPVPDNTHGTVYYVFKCDGTTPVYRNENANEPHVDDALDGVCDACRARFAYKVAVSSKLLGKGTSVADISMNPVNGYVKSGESITVKAQDVLEFVGWYLPSDMDEAYQIKEDRTALSTELTYTFVPSEDVTLVAVYDKHTPTITVGTTSYEKIWGDENFKLDVSHDNSDADAVLTYSSSNEDVATVSETGVVTIVRSGIVEVSLNMVETANYKAAESKTITICVNAWDNIDRDGFLIKKVSAVTYTGKAIKPTPEVWDGNGEFRLESGKDYTISYKNNKNVYTLKEGEEGFNAKKAPTMIIKGKGNYDQKMTVYFTIKPRDITDTADTNIVAEDILVEASGKVQKKTPVVKVDGKKLGKADFTVSYPALEDVDLGEAAYKEPGTYPILITGKGNYTGTRTVNLIVAAKGTSLAKATIAKIPAQEFDGVNAVELDETELVVTAKVNGKKETLKKDVHYTVEYTDNTGTGTATVTVKAIEGSGFAGFKKATFKITGTSIAKAKVTGVENQVYTGSARELELKVTTAVKDATTGTKTDVVLTEGTDYTVAYTKNTTVGTATVTIRGIGKYAGSIKKTFKITAADITDSVTVKDGELTAKYIKGGVKPSVNLVFNGKTLTAGKDYTISYKNNKAVYTAKAGEEGYNVKKAPTITIKGKGNFKGTVSRTFVITGRSLTDADVAATMTVADKAVSTKKGGYISKITVTDADGKALKQGSDYSAPVYTMVNEAGETVTLGKNDTAPVGSVITVSVTGLGAYEDAECKALTATYRITAKDFTKVKIESIQKKYTGKAVVLTAADFVNEDGSGKVTYGSGKNATQLVYGEDFEIVPGSYKDNVKKGTATVTIRGCGEYGGTKTVKFKVGARSLLFWWL